MVAEVADRERETGVFRLADGARRALAHERAGRYREAWRDWERLRGQETERADWNAPLAASYLRYALAWTADGGEGSLAEAEAALVRGMSILTIDLAGAVDDVARLMMIARACEQRCILRAFGESWTSAARDALEAGEAGEVVGDRRQVSAAGAAATAALDLVALSAPSLATLAADLAQSCLRLSATLRAAGDEDAALGLEMRAEAVLRGSGGANAAAEPARPSLVAIEGGGAGAGEKTTKPRRPQLRLVTTPTG